MTVEQGSGQGSTRRLIGLFESRQREIQGTGSAWPVRREDPLESTREGAVRARKDVFSGIDGGRSWNTHGSTVDTASSTNDAREELRRLELARPAQASRKIFEDKIRKFAEEIRRTPSPTAVDQRQNEETSRRKRILAQRREAGRNKTMVASHMTELLQGKERDDTLLTPSALRGRGIAGVKRTSFEL